MIIKSNRGICTFTIALSFNILLFFFSLLYLTLSFSLWCFSLSPLSLFISGPSLLLTDLWSKLPLMISKASYHWWIKKQVVPPLLSLCHRDRCQRSLAEEANCDRSRRSKPCHLCSHHATAIATEAHFDEEANRDCHRRSKPCHLCSHQFSVWSVGFGVMVVDEVADDGGWCWCLMMVAGWVDGGFGLIIDGGWRWIFYLNKYV